MVCRDKNGKEKWREENLVNMLHDEGEQAILSAFFATTMSGYGAPPANLYLGLDTSTRTLAEADTLAVVTENSGKGYARAALSTAGTGLTGQDFYITQPTTYYQAQSKTITWTCSESAWTAVTKLFLCTVSTGTAGKLICSVALSTTRTLNPGDTIQCAMYIGLSE